MKNIYGWRDKNGNIYKCVIDTNDKTIKRGYFIFDKAEKLLKTKKELNNLCEKYKDINYKEVEE